MASRRSTPSGPPATSRLYRLLDDPGRGAACRRELVAESDFVDWALADQVVAGGRDYPRGERFRFELRDARGQLARVLTLEAGSGQRPARKPARFAPPRRERSAPALRAAARSHTLFAQPDDLDEGDDLVDGEDLDEPPPAPRRPAGATAFEAQLDAQAQAAAKIVEHQLAVAAQIAQAAAAAAAMAAAQRRSAAMLGAVAVLAGRKRAGRPLNFVQALAVLVGASNVT